MLPNTPQGVIAYYGALIAGGIVVQVNPLYTERELSYQLKDAGATFIVCLDILVPRVSSVREEIGLKHVVVTRIADYLPFPKNVDYQFNKKKQYNKDIKEVESNDTHLYKNIIASCSKNYKEVNIDHNIYQSLLQYTGDTTGKPKGVMLTHTNLVSNGLIVQKWM